MPIGEHDNPTGLYVADPTPAFPNQDWVPENPSCANTTRHIRWDPAYSNRGQLGWVVEKCIVRARCPAEAWEWLDDYLRLPPDPERQHIFVLENSPAWRLFRAKLKKLNAR